MKINDGPRTANPCTRVRFSARPPALFRPCRLQASGAQGVFPVRRRESAALGLCAEFLPFPLMSLRFPFDSERRADAVMFRSCSRPVDGLQSALPQLPPPDPSLGRHGRRHESQRRPGLRNLRRVQVLQGAGRLRRHHRGEGAGVLVVRPPAGLPDQVRRDDPVLLFSEARHSYAAMYDEEVR